MTPAHLLIHLVGQCHIKPLCLATSLHGSLKAWCSLDCSALYSKVQSCSSPACLINVQLQILPTQGHEENREVFVRGYEVSVL